MDSHTLNTPAHLSAFCSAAKILCSDNLPHQGVSSLDGVLPNQFQAYEQSIRLAKTSRIPSTAPNPLAELNTSWRGPWPPPNFMKTHEYYLQIPDFMVKISDPPLPEPLEPGLFFREANMSAGYTIHNSDIREKMPTTYFLPKQLSDKLPFSSKSLASLVELLGVSNLQGAISHTVTMCELAPMSGELKSCVRSIEDMASLVETALGQKARALVMQSTDGWGQDATIAAAVPMNGGKVTPTVVCHRSMFPYMVYYCHMLPGVKVYNVKLLIDDGVVKQKNRLVAICHMETSDWSANHAAFKLLGSGPGKIEACHFLFESAVTRVTQDEPTSAWPIK